MIEYALLFALGFLAATLTGLLVAPAIQRRIVAYTENRMKATMPLSPQEVRAQTDMARAAFAAENARVSQQLVREREKSTQLSIRMEAVKRDISRLAADNADLKAQIEDMNVEAGDLRSALRHEDQRFGQLKSQLEAAEREILHKKRDIEILNANRDLVQTDLNDSMIFGAARETELENLNSRIKTLRHEREKLLEGLRAAQAQLKDAGVKLSREEGRSRQLDAKLTRETAEIGRLREKLKNVAVFPKTAARPARTQETKSLLLPVSSPSSTNGTTAATGANGATNIDIASLEADVRDRSAAITQHLALPSSPEGDAALRDEIADIAARMIVLTDAREGAASPIRSLLNQPGPAADVGRTSLADRAKDMLPPSK